MKTAKYLAARLNKGERINVEPYFPILQEAKENNGYVNLEHINLNQLLFLLRRGYLQRNDNGFILTSKSIFLIQEFEKKEEKKGGE